MELAKEQRNAIFRAVATGGLDPSECELNYETYLTIKHIPTGSWLLAPPVTDGPRFTMWRWQIGTDPAITIGEPGIAIDLNQLLGSITNWSNQIVDWIDAPDLWELRHKWKNLSGRYNDGLNTPFTPEEQEGISAQLADIRASIKETYALTAEQEKNLDARFEEAEKASKRLGRKDWVLLFMGGLFSLILTDAITPGIAEHILTMAVHGFDVFLSAGPRALPGRAQ